MFGNSWLRSLVRRRLQSWLAEDPPQAAQPAQAAEPPPVPQSRPAAIPEPTAESNAMFGQILAALQRIPEADLTAELTAAPPARRNVADPVAAPPAPRNVEPVETPTRAGGRPVSPAMSATVRLLEANPQTTAGDLVRELGVTKSYARTLLRRAKEKAPAVVQPQQAPSPAVARDPAPVNATLEDLQRRLAQAEQNLQNLSAAPARQVAGLGRSGRSQVIHLAEKGQSPEEIASTLGLARGEVDFILKVERILVKSF